MSSSVSTITFLTDQMSEGNQIVTRKMFGEYAVYCQEKVVALVCDDQLFVKPTTTGQAFIQKRTSVEEKPAYPGAKPSFLISGDLCEDQDWLSELIRCTAAELPVPVKKEKRKKTTIPRKTPPSMSTKS